MKRGVGVVEEGYKILGFSNVCVCVCVFSKLVHNIILSISDRSK